MNAEAFKAALEIAFPPSDRPREILAGKSSAGDIPGELVGRIQGREWGDITLHDWAMTGVTPAVARIYFSPEAFAYYLPSILVGSIEDIDSVNLALEAILPSGADREPKGEWWSRFLGLLSPEKKSIISEFIRAVESNFKDQLSISDHELINISRNLWSI